MTNKNNLYYAENSYCLFNTILADYSLKTVANKLSLHVGTLNRWKQQNKVPNSYKKDLLRILKITEKTEKEIGLDQFYTKKSIAEKCFNIFEKVAKKLDVNINNYHFIEPSAGNGSFFDLLPSDRRIGIDIFPKHKEIIKKDYLNWLPSNQIKSIVIGNPPFGLRGNLALKFINHSYNFADIVAFILPPLFKSDGKGSAMQRVQGYKLVHSVKLPINSFYYPKGKEVCINTIFQIWTKINAHKIKIPVRKTCSSYIKVYSLSDGGTPSSTRNKRMLEKCDIYLPSTTFQKMCIFNSFHKLPHKRGYGVVIIQNKEEIKKIFKNNDWNKTAFLSTNSALNLRRSLIEDVVTEKGFYDKTLL